MHLKRFRGPTVQEALRRARADLGPDALVLSTRLVSSHGLKGWVGRREVELTAAIERGTTTASRDRRAAASDADVVARLCATGLDRELAHEVADALPAKSRRGTSPVSLRKALAERLASLAAGDDQFAQVEAFVGRPGVGKTTTIAKIAAQERARRGLRLGMIAADAYRVGAIEQLRLFADIIGSPFAIAKSAAELDDAIEHGGGPMLVDTAGRSPDDPHSRDLFERLGGDPAVRTHLVIAAGTSPRDVARIFDSYSAARPSRIILTKLDEAESLSPLVGVLRERQLPISYLGVGQRIPEDLCRATPGLLASSVVGDSVSPRRTS